MLGPVKKYGIFRLTPSQMSGRTFFFSAVGIRGALRMAAKGSRNAGTTFLVMCRVWRYSLNKEGIMEDTLQNFDQ